MNADQPIFTPNLVVGLSIALVGVVLILDRFGVLRADDVLQYWPVLLVLFGASIAWTSMRGGSEETRQRPIIGPGLVIGLLVLGFVFLQAFDRAPAAGRADGGAVRMYGVMGETRRAPHVGTFTGAEMTSVMGGTRLDLRDAEIAPGQEATIDVFVLMGGAEIFVPPGWVVDVRAVPVMGGVHDSRGIPRRFTVGDVPEAADRSSSGGPSEPAGPDAGPPPRLVVRGFIMMGGLRIRS